MALFRNPFIIHHRAAAIEIKDHALSLQTSTLEKSIAELLGVELYRYVGERTYLLPGIARHLLYIRTTETSVEDMKAASGFLERLLDDYFSTRPGVDKNVSIYHWHLAREHYMLDTVEALAGRFLIRVTDARLGVSDVIKIPRYLELINDLVSKTAEIVMTSTAKLK